MYNIEHNPTLLKKHVGGMHHYIINVVNSKDINAFSTPGYYIYTTSSLWNYVTSSSETEFIIGHEIGHSELHHISQQRDHDKLFLGGDKKAFRAEFSRKLEADADEYGWEMLSTNSPGLNVAGGAAFMRRIVNDNNVTGPSIYADHPTAQSRLNYQLQKIYEYSHNTVRFEDSNLYFNDVFITSGYNQKNKVKVLGDLNRYDTSYLIGGALARAYHDDRENLSIEYVKDEDTIYVDHNIYDNEIHCVGNHEELMNNIAAAGKTLGMKVTITFKESFTDKNKDVTLILKKDPHALDLHQSTKDD
jgi:hypothetical protein